MDAAVNNSASAPHSQQQQHNTIPLAPPHSTHPSTKYTSGDFVKEQREPAEYYVKYRNYERDYLRRINHKYFSGKKVAGTGRVFETITSVDGFTIKESSEPPIRRFLDLPSSKEEQSGGPQPPAKKPHRRET